MAKKVGGTGQKIERHPAFDLWELPEHEVRELFSRHLGILNVGGTLNITVHPNGSMTVRHDKPWVDGNETPLETSKT